MAKRKTVEIENLSNATPEYLTDELGAIRAQISALEKRKDLLSEALKGRARLLGEYIFKGEVFTSEIVEMSRSSLDSEAIRQEMDTDWIDAHTKVTSYQQINTKAYK